MSEQRMHDILRFWFGRTPAASLSVRDRIAILGSIPYWHGHYYNRFFPVDARMRRLFEGDIRSARNGAYEGWGASVEGRLALILLYDQFPRNIYRGTSDAFALDSRGYELARRCLATNEDQVYAPLIRSFYYLPLVHVEDLAIQDEAVDRYRQAHACATDGFSKWLLYMDLLGARRHRDIVHRFGRFPHRNRILNRDSTREELQFLKLPFSSF
ncbi:MAG: DUF924 domain-containing protein [Gammaproteobacteria bacterium]|nr:DUF924 domain-containing protein [Gammaproteobacteria bacterium]